MRFPIFLLLAGSYATADDRVIAEAVAALQRGEFAKAETHLLEGFKGLGVSRLYLAHQRSAASRLVQLYERWDAAEPGTGKAEHAAKWKATLEELSAPPKPPNAPS